MRSEINITVKRLPKRLTIGVSAFCLTMLLAAGVQAKDAFDVAVVVDLSGSMGRAARSDRFAELFRWIDTFTNSNDRIAVVGMGYGASLILPFTDKDEFDINALRPKLSSRAKYTDVAGGLENAYYELKNNTRSDSKRLLLMYSDAKIDLPHGKWDIKNSMRYLLNSLIPSMKKENIRFMGVVPDGLQANFHLLQELAGKTNGRYFRGFPASSGQVRAAFLRERSSKPVARVKRTYLPGEPVKQKTKMAQSIKVNDATTAAETTKSAESEGFSKDTILLTSVFALGFVAVIGAMVFMIRRGARMQSVEPEEVERESTQDAGERMRQSEELGAVLNEVKHLKELSAEHRVDPRELLGPDDEDIDFGEPNENLSVSLVTGFLDYSDTDDKFSGTDEIASRPVFSHQDGDAESNLSVSSMETLIGTSAAAMNSKKGD